MKFKCYKLFSYPVLLCCVLTMLLLTNTQAQTTITTETGTNFTGANGVTGPGAVTFVVENTNAAAIVLTQVDVFCGTASVTSGTIPTLWYSATSLSGAVTVATPTWTQIATGAPITFTTNGYYTALSGLSFIIPGGTQYRFALQSTLGVSYSGAAGPPSPNTFSGGGVNLKVYDAQIAAANIGYGGAFPTPPNNPRAFTGRIVFTAATPCTGTPNPGTTLSSANPACPSVNFNLSLQNSTPGTGVGYQWQTSPNGTTGWINAGGSSTSSTYTTSQTVTTFYRCNVTCGANTTASSVLQVTMNSFVSCYCSSGATSAADEDILNVTVGTLNNTSTCGQVGPGPGSTAFLYNNYTSGTGAPAAPAIGQGSSVPFSIGVGTCGTSNFNNSVAIFIDLNANGVFDVPAERLYLSAATTLGPHTESGTLVIPPTATLGVTRMRVICAETAPANIVPCGTISGAATSWGETEDYLVNIVSCVAGGFTGQPSAVTISCGQTASFTVAGNGTGAAFQWQENISGTFNNITNGGIYGGAQSTTLTLTGVPASYNNYQYRCVITGTCTPSTNSNAVTLTVTQPPAPTISPAPPVSACLGTAVPISITTAAGFGPPVVVSSTQTHLPPLTCTSPCNTTSSLAIAGVPTGAVITQAKVTFNMAHTFVGDMVINLRAPNGNILNLFNVDGAGGDNFVNTVVSSTGATNFAAGTPPYTGTFAAKAASAVGPTGNVSNVTTFGGLYSVPNGPWTLVLQDVAGGDEPFLSNWTLELTYTPIVPVQGTWTPTAGLFTNAAGTTQYTGGLASTVYAKPGGSTSYSVSYVIGGCTSPSTTIPVTVNTPVGISIPPANATVCTDKVTTFSVTATGTSPTYQWEVDNGTGFAAISNNANYSGATGATLTITAPPTSWNTFKYRVVVSGAAPCPSITSGNATLTVNALPVISLNSSPYRRLFPGLRTTITGTSTPAAAPNGYAWFRNGSPVPGAGTGSSILVDVDGLGAYQARVTDINGCVNTSNSLAILDSITSKVFIYPSPNKGQFQVRFYSVAGNQVPRTLTVFDAKGDKVLVKTYAIGKPYDRMDVDLTNAGAGIYRIELGDMNGVRIQTGTVVVLK